MQRPPLHRSAAGDGAALHTSRNVDQPLHQQWSSSGGEQHEANGQQRAQLPVFAGQSPCHQPQAAPQAQHAASQLASLPPPYWTQHGAVDTTGVGADAGQPMLTLSNSYAARRGGPPPAKQPRTQPPQAAAQGASQPGTSQHQHRPAPSQAPAASGLQQLRGPAASHGVAQDKQMAPAGCRPSEALFQQHQSGMSAQQPSSQQQAAPQQLSLQQRQHQAQPVSSQRRPPTQQRQHQPHAAQQNVPFQQQAAPQRHTPAAAAAPAQSLQTAQLLHRMSGHSQAPVVSELDGDMRQNSQKQARSQQDAADPTCPSQPGVAAEAAPIPGPAGVLQRQMASGAVPSTLADVVGPTQAAARARAAGESGQSADPDFLSEAWQSALEALDLPHFDEGSSLLRHTIRRVLTLAEPCQIPRMLVLVVSATLMPSGEGHMLVKDPTGRMGGCLSRAVMVGEDCPRAGAVLMLQQVSLLPLGHGGPCLLCITPKSIAQVLPPDPGGLPSQAGTAVAAPSQQLVTSSALAVQQQQQQQRTAAHGSGGRGANSAPLQLEGPVASQRQRHSQRRQQSQQQQHSQPSSQLHSQPRQDALDPAPTQEQRRQAQQRAAAEQYARARSQAAQPAAAPRLQAPSLRLPPRGTGRDQSTCSIQRPSACQLQASAEAADPADGRQSTGAAQLPLVPPRPVFADATNGGGGRLSGAEPPTAACQQLRHHLSVQSSLPEDNEDMLLDGLDEC